ncbi:MAG TPA: AAA family ATPase, partial [Pirellulaceae bacterium]|nr:AAA family ATPase [Pirellulaceae bacterium]
STHLGVEPDGKSPSMYDVLVSSRPLAEVRQKIDDNLWLAASDINLAAAEVELAGVVGREVILRDLLLQDEGAFDFVFMDCGPSLGVLTLNALAAANEVFIPLQPHFLALHGLSKLLKTIEVVSKRLNRNLRLSGVLLCMYDAGTRLAAEVTGDIDAYFKQTKAPDSIAANARTFETRIRRNIRLAEAPSFGQSIFEYAPTSNGAEDYRALGKEVLAMGNAALRRAA